MTGKNLHCRMITAAPNVILKSAHSIIIDHAITGEQQLESWLTSPNRRHSIRSNKIALIRLHDMNGSTV
jgi:hypothetical protein